MFIREKLCDYSWVNRVKFPFGNHFYHYRGILYCGNTDVPISRLIANRSRIAQPTSDATFYCAIGIDVDFPVDSTMRAALLAAFPRFADIIYNHRRLTTYGSRSRNVYSWPVASVSHEIRERARSPFARSRREESRGAFLRVASVPEAYYRMMDVGLSLVIKAREMKHEMEFSSCRVISRTRGQIAALTYNVYDWRHLFRNKKCKSSETLLL